MSDMNDNRRNITPLEYFNAEFTYSTFSYLNGTSGWLSTKCQVAVRNYKRDPYLFLFAKTIQVTGLKISESFI